MSKQRLKSVMMAASIMATGAACAATCNTDTFTLSVEAPTTLCDPDGASRMADFQLNSGTATWTLSNGFTPDVRPKAVGGLVGFMNFGHVQLSSPLGDATTHEENVLLTTGRINRGIMSIGAPVSTLVANSSTGQIEGVYSIGGGELYAQVIPDVLDGGRVTIRNLRIDLVNKAVYADITGQAMLIDGTYEPLETIDNLHLWDIGTITGPTALPAAGMLAAANGDFSILQAAGYDLTPTEPGATGEATFAISAHLVFDKLQVTTFGLNKFNRYLGLTNGLGLQVLRDVNAQASGWGSITSDLVLGPAIPEPSTWALMGMGLVGISLVRRHRQPG
jgi:hypothetical protein